MKNTLFTNRFALVSIAFVAMAAAVPDAGAQAPGAVYEVVSTFDVADGRPNGVIQTRDGQFYGVTSGPGIDSTTLRGQMGTVFAMDAAGTRTTLHRFQGEVIGRTFDGSPLANLLEVADGTLYGTTWNVVDPFFPPGQIFKITPGGPFTTVALTGGLQAGVIHAQDGRLYGTAEGSRDPTDRVYGIVFRIEIDGTRTVLHQFDGTDGLHPVAELLEVDDGSLYGTSQGGTVLPPEGGTFQSPSTIFRIDPATAAFSVVHRFPAGTRPVGRMIQATDGLIYGTTAGGGAFGFGFVFSLDAAGTVTTLHDFAGADGANPNAGVIQGTDGRLYGMTTNGGRFDGGTVFVMDVTGGLTTLHDFALTDGANPVNELFQASDGAFYGAAPMGGAGNSGVIFRVRLEPSPPTDGYFEIVSRNSGKCLDVFGASTEAGASVIQWICHGGANQQWQLEPAGGGGFRIIARHSGLALDVFGASLDDVTPIIQWPANGGDNQVWTLTPAGDGYVSLIVRHSGKAMDIEFASTDDGARVIQYLPHGGANQQWLLRVVVPTPAVTAVDG